MRARHAAAHFFFRSYSAPQMAAPTGPSSAEAEAMAHLQDDLQSTLIRNKVPYAVIAAMVDYGSTTIGEFVDMHDDKTTCVNKFQPT